MIIFTHRVYCGYRYVDVRIEGVFDERQTVRSGSITCTWYFPACITDNTCEEAQARIFAVTVATSGTGTGETRYTITDYAIAIFAIIRVTTTISVHTHK